MSNDILDLLEQAANGRLPSDEELNRPAIGPKARQELADAATVIAGIATGGDAEDARSRAQTSAERIGALADAEVESFNDLIRSHRKRTPQQLAADALKAAAEQPDFNDLIRGTATDEDHGS